MEETGAFVAATFITNLGAASSYTMMAGVLANFGPNSQDYILPVWPTFPTRCDTNGFFHFSIYCSNRLGWYWGRQRTSWIRNSVTVFRCRKTFVREILTVTDNREHFLTAKISRYTVCYHPYLVSMLFADLLSLHLVTFLMFFILVGEWGRTFCITSSKN